MKPKQTNLNTELWSQIESFNLDYPISAYNFSTRLAAENKWTRFFTQKAILEYKRFMYLAALSDKMVSPSETVDKVWHMHLIFTKSYAKFCKLLGKIIHHVPSTRTADERAKFQQAKEHTERVYQETFGDMPSDIWQYDNMYESLGWEREKLNEGAIMTVIILIFSALLFPLCILLVPLYTRLNNPYFLIGYITIIIIANYARNKHNNRCFSDFVKSITADSFLYHLQPAEVSYLRRNKYEIVHNSVNTLVKEGKIAVDADGTLRTIGHNDIRTMEEYAVKETIAEASGSHYRSLVPIMASKAIFKNTENAINELQKQFYGSKQCERLFAINFIVLSALLLLGVVRMITGILRGKPVILLAYTLLFLFVYVVFALIYLKGRFFATQISNWYRNEVLPNNADINQNKYDYALSGTLVASMIPLVRDFNNPPGGNGSSSAGGGCGGGGCGGGGCGGCGN